MESKEKPEPFVGSFAVVAPRVFDVQSALKKVISQNKQVIHFHSDFDESDASLFVKDSHNKSKEWHVIESNSSEVWKILGPAFADRAYRLIGLFDRYPIPADVSKHVNVLELGDVVAGRASKKSISRLTHAIKTGEPLTYGGWDMHVALVDLCYEVEFGKKRFSQAVIDKIPVKFAYDYFQRQDVKGLSDAQLLNRVNRFVYLVRG